MEEQYWIYIGIGVFVLFYIIARMMLSGPHENEFDREYSEILNSPKYEVKGQYNNR